VSRARRTGYARASGHVEVVSAFNSNSAKTATATCAAGKRAVGAGGAIGGGVTGDAPTQLTDVVITRDHPKPGDAGPRSLEVTAVEEEPTAAQLNVTANLLCPNAP
jgi:hypothetical protein